MRTRAALVAVLAAASLAACGGGSSDDTSTTAADPLAAVKQSGVLKVGTEGTYSPFTFHDPKTNALTGYDVDVITAVAQQLGVKPQFSETPFDAIFGGLEAKRWDVVANQVSITDERKAKYDFSTPYTVSQGVVVTRADDTSVTSLADVKGKTSAQSVTSNFAQTATKAGAKVEAVEGFTQAVTLLKQKRVDITINDNLAVLDYQKSTGDKSVKIAAQTEDRTEQAFAFRKDSGLAAGVDAALEKLRTDGTLTELSTKWFGSDVSR
jgi:cystine transport system substrate-binding protein